jgi:hypothetical protein
MAPSVENERDGDASAQEKIRSSTPIGSSPVERCLACDAEGVANRFSI